MTGWRQHHGGDNPFAGVDGEGRPLPQPVVRVRFRCGLVARDLLPADRWRWRWGPPFPPRSDFDIIAFQETAQ